MNDPSNAATDAPLKRGGTPVSGRPKIQDFAMLKIAEPATAGNQSLHRINSPDRTAALWLDAEVKRAGRGVTTQIIELTPALARVLLERNTGNRGIIESVLNSYVRDIESGDWSFNGQTVIVADDGMLNDGQHRCTAVVLANKSIMTVLVIGVPRGTRMTLDQGRQRRASDYLSMDGHINTSLLASTSGFVLLYWSRGTLFGGGSNKATKTEIRRFVEGHPEITDSVAFVQIKGADAYGGRSILAFCHYVFSQRAGRAAADDFIRSIVVGDSLRSRDPLLYCRNRLVAERDRLRPNDRAELLFRAWNAHRTHQNPAKLQVLGGALPTLEA
jgi:hypothetical protein